MSTLYSGWYSPSQQMTHILPHDNAVPMDGDWIPVCVHKDRQMVAYMLHIMEIMEYGSIDRVRNRVLELMIRMDKRVEQMEHDASFGAIVQRNDC